MTIAEVTALNPHLYTATLSGSLISCTMLAGGSTCRLLPRAT